jgi:hypothetical protein
MNDLRPGLSFASWTTGKKKANPMPRGPRGEKRPAAVIGAAVMVAKIATGEIVDNPRLDSAASASLSPASVGRTRNEWQRE